MKHNGHEEPHALIYISDYRVGPQRHKGRLFFCSDRIKIQGFALTRHNVWSAPAPKRITWHNLMLKSRLVSLLT